MRKLKIAVIFGLVLSILLGSVGGFSAQCNDIRGKVLRLHILANSDSKEDQALKLKVRDRVLKETGAFFVAQTKSEAQENVKEHIDLVKSVAKDEIKKQGYDYDVDVKLVEMFFNTRQYDDITMPAGKYQAMRITIGAAKGKNWWCVLYPPMCIPSAQPKKELGDVLSDEQLNIVEENPKYEVRFAIVELFENIKEKLFG
ncbi:MAG: stage sporulation protein [Caproiciproducens sp.]|jgi:stage II sporulation protein R|nr:stage sporulation protein [Caproiciproducens sp.]